MAVNLSELLALPRRERMKLAETLMESTVPRDIGPLLRDLAARLERTNRKLDQTVERLSGLDERLERSRASVRDAVIRSGEVWPFPLPR
jgi:hypothetical protein